MITVGIDMGARIIKVVVLREGKMAGRAAKIGGFDAGATARDVLAVALKEAGSTRTAMAKVIATGAGREEAPDKNQTLTEVGCAARGALHFFPEARTVIDVGAEEARAIRCDERGKVVDFAINEKCAAGTGAFTEAMARALEVTLDDLGPLSLKSAKTIPMNAQCVVFAESEVVSMIHSNVAKEDVARAVHDAMASRTIALVRRVGLRPPMVLVGGLAKNSGFVDSLKRGLEGETLHIPRDPEFCCALGAALAAAENS